MNIFDLLFPKECLECSQKGGYICHKCLKKVGNGKLDFINKNFSAFKYEGVVRKAIIKLKYNFASNIAIELIDSVYNNFQIPIEISNVVIVPVPLYKARENWRGYNQSALLGKIMAEKMNWNFEENLVKRHEGSIPQAHLSREKRLRNMRGKYAVNMQLASKYLYNDIIVFDDVITTGATINECKRMLTKAGVKNVYGLSICS